MNLGRFLNLSESVSYTRKSRHTFEGLNEMFCYPLYACMLQTSYLLSARWRCSPCCFDGRRRILFYFQDSNPFASLVFYWEPLNRQVSEQFQDNQGLIIDEPSEGPQAGKTTCLSDSS